MSPVIRSQGSSSGSEFKIQAPNNADAFLEIAEGSSPELKKARDPLIYYLQDIALKLRDQKDPDKAAMNVCDLSLRLIDKLIVLGAEDYRVLAATLMVFRKSPTPANFRVLTNQDANSGYSDKIKEITMILKDIYNPVPGLIGWVPLATLADDTVELMRLVCRQAINMADPKWESAQPGFNHNDRIKIAQGRFKGSKFVENFAIIIRPIVQKDPKLPDPFVSGIYYREAPGKPEVLLKLIADGETVVVGRHLEKKSVYGLSINDQTLSEITAAAYVDNDCASRAGIKIFKLNDIYVFNKLSRNDYIVTSANRIDPRLTRSITYSGDTYFDGKNWTIGRSEIQ